MSYSLAQVNDRNGLIAMCIIFSIASIMAVYLRFYARRLKGLQFQADDWLIAAALVCQLSSTHVVGVTSSLISINIPGACTWLEWDIFGWYVQSQQCDISFLICFLLRMRSTSNYRSLARRQRLAITN